MTKPDYERGNVRLWNRDCLEWLPTLEAGSVDAVVTDPPYGVEFAQWDGQEKRALFAAWLAEMERVGQVVTFTCGWLRLCDWCAIKPPKCFLYWYKPGCMGFGPFGFNHVDPMPVYGKVQFVGTHDVIRAPIIVESDWHPTQKPIGLAMGTLAKFPKTIVILDPFMGSGTTGVACIRLGKQFLGCEIDPKYFDLACRRIDAAFDSLALIDPTPPAVRQATLFTEADQ